MKAVGGESRLARLGVPQFVKHVRRAGSVARLAVTRFLSIDGAEWAGAFSFNAFFSLFPLMILLVTIASAFVERATAGQAAISYLEGYVPLDGEMKSHVFEVIAGVINGRSKAGVIALLALVWAALQGFSTLVSITNAAWGHEPYKWWRLPLKSLTLLGVTGASLLLGMALPAIAKMAEDRLFPVSDFRSWAYGLMVSTLPLVVVFFSLSLFYRLAPRRPVTFSQVWIAALCATGLLEVAERLFVVYLQRFATLNALYGAFGGIMALLLWVYVSGCIFIFGACLGAARAEGARASVAEEPAINAS